ncbi:hypothetical protein [Alcaligenes endophyticus]|uniref:PXPV repeat-containing protein n=1 Tax=Alcaligenes endophyticus TaxID=1929088 RepID=A0ABT8EHF9_9BURK|nr:hypothetical protein [Alcaligenes endophyticus]MCX5592073.1 hypothetical protein [Alcaligenes endophyticus]MDN4120720.1 hypothetical protein [Alcaligenes endophyticus]
MKKWIVAGVASVLTIASIGAHAGGLNVDVNIGIPGFGYGGSVYHPPVHVIERPVVVVSPPRVHHHRPAYVEYRPHYHSKKWRKEQKRAHKRWRKQQERYWDD